MDAHRRNNFVFKRVEWIFILIYFIHDYYLSLAPLPFGQWFQQQQFYMNLIWMSYFMNVCGRAHYSSFG